MTQSSPPSRDGSVFISYARADDQKPPFEDAIEGWVTFFWDQLRFELTDRVAQNRQNCGLIATKLIRLKLLHPRLRRH